MTSTEQNYKINIKKVKVVTCERYENLSVLLKSISVLKQLKFLSVVIYQPCHINDIHKKFDVQKFGHIREIIDCTAIIKNQFPSKIKVVIANRGNYGDLTNLIEKVEEENPKIVNLAKQRLEITAAMRCNATANSGGQMITGDLANLCTIM